ncbi:hypothetical protein ACHWQZ_G012393 [Mnemiopsis leidyi]
MPTGECGGDPLRVAVQHLQATREKRRQLNAYHQQGVGQQWATPHHTNYSAGYTDSVRDVTRMMVNNPTLSSGVRSNIAQFISHKQEYNNKRTQQCPGGGFSQLGFEGSPIQTNPNLRYNFFYPTSSTSSTPQIQHAPSTPYTYWKPWG